MRWVRKREEDPILGWREGRGGVKHSSSSIPWPTLSVAVTSGGQAVASGGKARQQVMQDPISPPPPFAFLYGHRSQQHVVCTALRKAVKAQR